MTTRKWKATQQQGIRVNPSKKPILCLSWSTDIRIGKSGRKLQYFASCSDNKVSIHEVEMGVPRPKCRVLVSYKDPDELEEFQVCVFGGRSKIRGTKGPQLLIVAGKAKRIKIIDTQQHQRIFALRGHGSDIHDLKVSPQNEALLVSASKDESVRLWNLESLACIAIFAGHNGHTRDIFSISWHAQGQKFATAGKDKYVRLWSIENPTVAEALQASASSGKREHFRPVIYQFPYFRTDKIHNNDVDCVQWLGDMILSKSSCSNQIVLWKPDLSNTEKVANFAYQPPEDVVVLRKFELVKCSTPLARFGIDWMGKYLAMGNPSGEVDIWEIDNDCQKAPFQTLKRSNGSQIRMLAFSPDGETVVTAADDGTVSRWDLN